MSFSYMQYVAVSAIKADVASPQAAWQDNPFFVELCLTHLVHVLISLLLVFAVQIKME